MNNTESRYYNTSLLMNQALVELLNKKDYEFITIKEICKRAGVNRSTFYLHYDTVDDLLNETIENINKAFLSCFSQNTREFSEKLKSTNLDDLVFITPEYLVPYLNFIKENKMVYQVSAKHPNLMQSFAKFDYLKLYILTPIFNKFNIDINKRNYFSSYYINGIFGIVNEWIKGGCKTEIDNLCNIIIECVRPFEKDNAK